MISNFRFNLVKKSNKFFHKDFKRTFSSSNSLFSKRVLVFAEHDNKVLGGSTLNAINAALQLKPSEGIDVFIVGSQCKDVAEQAKKAKHVDRVLVCDNAKFEHQLAEPLSSLLKSVQEKNGYSHIISSSTTTGKSLLPRLAALLDVQPISDVIAIQSDDTFVRPIYAGNAIATVQSLDGTKILTIRSTSFPSVEVGDNNAPIVEIEDTTDGYVKSKFVSSKLAESERPDLTSAKIVISGGRGLKNGDNFKLLYDLADQLGSSVAIGASRAAVDDGFVPNDLQVGQTGKIVAPELYIAVGISGAIQHLAGMKDSKVIVAINKDEDAPIFQVSDYGLVDDLFKAVPELTEKIKSKK